MGHLQRGEWGATGAFKPDLTSLVRKVIDFAHMHTEFSNTNQTVKHIFAPPLSLSLCAGIWRKGRQQAYKLEQDMWSFNQIPRSELW